MSSADPSHDWDRYQDQMERRAFNRVCANAVKRDGLYSKFWVYKTRTEQIDADAEGNGGGLKVEGEPLTVPSFVLVPFNEKGEVRDENAVKALRAYAESVGGKLAEDIMAWVEGPKQMTDATALMNQSPDDGTISFFID